MVGVDNHLQVVGQTPVHHLFNTCDPCLVNAHGLWVGDMTLPADGNTYRIEAGILHGLNHLLCYNGIAPSRLGLDAAVRVTDGHRLAVLSWC